MTQLIRRRRFLTILTMLCIIVVLEFWARTRVADWQGILGAIVLTDDGKPPCFRLRPNASGVYDGWLQSIASTRFHIDDRGLRVDGKQVARIKGTERLALVGDSHIFGLGVNFPDTLGATLERALVAGHDKAQRRCLTSTCSSKIEVLNLGVPGYDFDGMVTRVIETAPELHPSVLVVAIGANDLPQRICGQHSKPARSVFRHFALGRVALAAIYKGERREALCDADELRRVSKGLRQMKDATPNARRLIVSLSPLCHDEAAQALQETATKAGFELISVHPLFSQLTLNYGVTSIVGDGHLNQRGNRKLAQKLSELLLKQRSKSATTFNGQGQREEIHDPRSGSSE